MTKYKLAKKREKKVGWIVLCCLGLCLIEQEWVFSILNLNGFP